MRMTDLYKSVVEEVGSSFIFGTATAAVKGLLGGESNIIAKHVQAIRRGASYAEYTLLFNAMLYACRLLGVKKKVSALGCIFLCSYLTAKRNGTVFALKSAVFGLAMSISRSCVS